MNKYTAPNSSPDRLRLCMVLLVYLMPTAIVAQGISEIRIDAPRDFGYTIGDKIRHAMHLTLSEPYELDITSLPESGRLNRWLEVSGTTVNVEKRDHNLSYHVTVDYQIFNAPPQLTSVTMPQLEFLTTGGAHPIPIFIPEWTFSIGPITDSDGRRDLRLRPDRHPQPIPLTNRAIRLMTWTLLLVGLLSYLAYRRFLLPRFRHERYPFSTALRALRRLQRMDPEPENYQLGLKALHAAVDATAGQIVFAGNLDQFLSANSEYAALKPGLSAFYARSQDVFFKNADAVEPHAALQELVDICRQCRVGERSVA